jgi:cation transport ATPase
VSNFIPVVLAIAHGAFIIWYFFSAVRPLCPDSPECRAVVACPCALGSCDSDSGHVGDGSGAELG